MDHLLARAGLDQLRFRVAQIERRAEQLDRLAERGRRLGFHQRAEFGGDFSTESAPSAGPCVSRAERVDGDGKRSDDPVDRGLLDEQRLAAAGRFHLAVGEFGDLELGRDRLRDAPEFPSLVKSLDKIAKRCVSHVVGDRNITFALGNSAAILDAVAGLGHGSTYESLLGAWSRRFHFQEPRQSKATMTPMHSLSRRCFLQTAAALALPTIIPARVLGAEAPSNQINVGFIGTGDHGTDLEPPPLPELQ